MRRREYWDDGDYMEWAERERIIRQEVAEINREMRQRKAENYRKTEFEEKKNE